MVAILLLLSTWIVTSSTAGATLQVSRSETATCRIMGELVRLPDLSEASGIAASRTRPGVLWAHNDSGLPIIVALDQRGAIKGRVRLVGAKVDDWEDIAVGPCPQGSCVYVGDIGDNRGRRQRITIYRTVEPSPDATASQPVEAFHATYPDGPHDAESLFVTPAGEVFIVTKSDPGSVAIYRFPLRSGSATLERVGEPLTTKANPKDRPTGADSSPDGQWIAVRTASRLAFYAAADLTSGRWRESFRYDLESVHEPQGEGVTFGDDGTIYLVGESGGKAGGGTFARLACALVPVR
jgi:hypothetical protein